MNNVIKHKNEQTLIAYFVKKIFHYSLRNFILNENIFSLKVYKFIYIYIYNI